LIARVSASGAANTVLRELVDALDRQPALVRGAFEAGVRVLAGTDAGLVAHGRISHEVEHFIRAGVEPSAAVGAASWDGRSYLGLRPIVEGAPADLVVYDRDPRDDPAVLRTPRAMILDGRRV
jgi:imidazolonepropionase-like amidohydrolase